MVRQLIVKPAADAEIADAKGWYDRQREGLGDDFLLCVEEVFDLIGRSPEIFPRVHGDLRISLLRRFPYSVLYLIDENQVVVLAVFHSHRNPSRWQE